MAPIALRIAGPSKNSLAFSFAKLSGGPFPLLSQEFLIAQQALFPPSSPRPLSPPFPPTLFPIFPSLFPLFGKEMGIEEGGEKGGNWKGELERGREWGKEGFPLPTFSPLLPPSFHPLFPFFRRKIRFLVVFLVFCFKRKENGGFRICVSRSRIEFAKSL